MATKKTVTKASGKKPRGIGKRMAKATQQVVVIHGENGVIPEGEYSGRRDLIDIEIAADVEGILDKAFEGCPKLRSVKISGNEKMTIGYEAFANCPSLERVEMPNLKFDESAETLIGGFVDVTGDVDFYMPPANAFGGSKKLCNVSMFGTGGDYVSIDGGTPSKARHGLLAERS